MIDLVEDLANYQNVYVLYDSISSGELSYAVYRVKKVERRGAMKYYAQLQTNSRHKSFKKTLNIVGLSIEFKYSCEPCKIFADLNELKKYFCERLKKNPETNPKLIKKLTKMYPEYFV